MGQFVRTKENFICEYCDTEVVGDGYTNHCPECLWSKHVDINPGDRMETCRGLMKPISLEKHNDAYRVFQRCIQCGHEMRNKLKDKDNFDPEQTFIN